jgi:hypothetical protein
MKFRQGPEIACSTRVFSVQEGTAVAFARPLSFLGCAAGPSVFCDAPRRGGDSAKMQQPCMFPALSGLTLGAPADTYAKLFRQAVSFTSRHGIPEADNKSKDLWSFLFARFWHQPRRKKLKRCL